MSVEGRARPTTLWLSDLGPGFARRPQNSVARALMVHPSAASQHCPWARGLELPERCVVDSVYVVDNTVAMPTVVQSCRIEKDHAALLARQAKRRHLEVSTLSSLYLKEKALEEEFPGIGFRDGIGGREAYVQGHRVAVWEVADVLHEVKTVAKAAEHFRWPPALVRCAMAFAKAFPSDIDQQRQAEVGA